MPSFTTWEALAPGCCVTGGLCNPHDSHLFASRTNGALCHEEDARLSPCHSPSEAGVTIAGLRGPPSPLTQERGAGLLRGIAEVTLKSQPPFLRHAKTNGHIWGGNRASRWFSSGRWLETKFM